MTPTPVALGLTLCDYLLIEEHTRKPSLIGCFTALTVPSFPSPPRPFDVYAELTDSAGRGVAELVISRLDTGEAIYRQAKTVSFPDRFHVGTIRDAGEQLRLPSAGRIPRDAPRGRGTGRPTRPDHQPERSQTMSNSTPQNPADPQGGDRGRVESIVGENVVTIIVDEPGDTTIRPAPDYVKRVLEQYKQRMRAPRATGDVTPP
jgi:hypothetical protein